MVFKINSKKAVLPKLLLSLIIISVLLVIFIPFIILNTDIAKDTVQGVYNCKNLGGWNGKCIHKSESCEALGLKDWSKLPIYDNACYDKSKPETKELKCCMYPEDPKAKIYIIVEEKDGSSKLLKNDKTRTVYTGGLNKENVEVIFVINNILNDYLPKPCERVLFTIQLPELTDSCMDKEKVYECFVESNDKGKGTCTLPEVTAIGDNGEEKYLNLKPGGCYFTIIGYSADDEVIFSDKFWLRVVQDKYPS